MRSEDLLALAPRDLDARVQTAIDAGFAQQVWVTVSRLPDVGLEPAVHEALVVARARLRLAGYGPGTAQGWLAEARGMAAARGADLDAIVDLAGLRADLAPPAQVVDGSPPTPGWTSARSGGSCATAGTQVWNTVVGPAATSRHRSPAPAAAGATGQTTRDTIAPCCSRPR